MDVYNPYNANNRFFTEKDIHGILRKHGLPHYRITNQRVFQTAMVHTTYVRRTEYTTPDGRPAQLAPCPSGVMPLQDESYECLEFEGDSVLGVCVATYLRRKYPEKKQGFLTDARKELVNNERIGELSKKIGLNRFYIISRHNEASVAIDGRNNAKKLGDIFEAFLGALWTDCGNRFHIVYTFVISVLEAYVDIDEAVNSATNYKHLFQKYCQKTLGCTPTYAMLSNDTKQNEIRVAVCDASGKHIAYGVGSTRKKAEQMACKEALALSGGEYSDDSS
jgi:ribonuclease-3